MDAPAAHALIRFGLGRRGAEPPPADPHAWLARQLDAPDPVLARPGAADGLVAEREDRRARRDGAEANRVRDLVAREQAAAIDTLLTTAAPFRERLVWFWANHFTVSLRRGEISAVIFPFIREAIRPHVTGRFGDMLLAVMRHPAMLSYLDNVGSIGPDSPQGLRSRRGLNENLARECLELHTVTPEAGYTQRDVTAFAGVLTGWSYATELNPPQFVFRLSAHQPGPKTVMGQTFPHGLGGGLEALAFLAGHKATHRSLATKLVRHFVADDPPPDAVARVEAVLRGTRGDLRAAALEVTRLPQAWQPLAKLRSPMDYAVAVLRALDPPAAARPDLHAALTGLGQPLLSAPMPDGWPDTAADWGGGEALLRRADWAWSIAGAADAAEADPVGLGEASLGGLLSEATRAQLRDAGSQRTALTLLLASPEFQRR
jgi:uncharacterized protein (DUF1800 family)